MNPYCIYHNDRMNMIRHYDKFIHLHTSEMLGDFRQVFAGYFAKRTLMFMDAYRDEIRSRLGIIVIF